MDKIAINCYTDNNMTLKKSNYFITYIDINKKKIKRGKKMVDFFVAYAILIIIGIILEYFYPED